MSAKGKASELCEVSSVLEFLEAVDRLNGPQKWDYRLFRGQSVNGRLLPKIARSETSGLMALREGITKVEERMISRFRRQVYPYIDAATLNEWDLLALAQHNGMATRLLDWTTNPLVALWFATCKTQSNNIGEAVVWAFSPESEDECGIKDLKRSPLNCSRTKVFQPKHISGRIRAQAGCFTVHKFFEAEKRFIPLENNASYKKRLQKIRVAQSEVETIQQKLNKYGINRAALFPDIEGLCCQIEWDERMGVETGSVGGLGIFG